MILLGALCIAYVLDNHNHLPFSKFVSKISFSFEIIHAALWTSPVPCFSSYNFFLVLIDNYRHWIWTYPFRSIAKVYDRFVSFHRLIHVQFQLPINSLQCDIDRVFQNNQFKQQFTCRGILHHFPFCYTSPQNEHVEHMIRTISNMICSFLFRAHCPPQYLA